MRRQFELHYFAIDDAPQKRLELNPNCVSAPRRPANGGVSSFVWLIARFPYFGSTSLIADINPPRLKLWDVSIDRGVAEWIIAQVNPIALIYSSILNER